MVQVSATRTYNTYGACAPRSLHNAQFDTQQCVIRAACTAAIVHIVIENNRLNTSATPFTFENVVFSTTGYHTANVTIVTPLGSFSYVSNLTVRARSFVSYCHSGDHIVHAPYRAQHLPFADSSDRTASRAEHRTAVARVFEWYRTRDGQQH